MPMQSRAKPIPRKHLIHPQGPRPNRDGQWLKRFWAVFALTALLAIATLAYTYFVDQDSPRDAYVPLQTKTVAGNFRNVTCNLSLVVTPAQEKAIQERQAALQNIVNVTLARVYDGEAQPPLSDVRDALREEINRSLPAKLRVQDVLIQELLVGMAY